MSLLRFVLLLVTMSLIAVSALIAVLTARYEKDDAQRYGEFAAALRDFVLALVVLTLGIDVWVTE